MHGRLDGRGERRIVGPTLAALLLGAVPLGPALADHDTAAVPDTSCTGFATVPYSAWRPRRFPPRDFFPDPKFSVPLASQFGNPSGDDVTFVGIMKENIFFGPEREIFSIAVKAGLGVLVLPGPVLSIEEDTPLGTDRLLVEYRVQPGDTLVAECDYDLTVRDEDPIFLPVRWCAMRGSLTVEDPASLPVEGPGATTDGVLLSRLERATARIWDRGGRILFESALPAGSQQSIPVIDDPCLEGAGACPQGCPRGPGGTCGLPDFDCDAAPNAPSCDPVAEGWIVKSAMGVDSSEQEMAEKECRDAWSRLAPSAAGPLAIVVRGIRDIDGPGPAAFGGPTNTVFRPGACQLEPPRVCADDANLACLDDLDCTILGGSGPCVQNYMPMSANEGRVFATDNFNDDKDWTLAHELGHVLYLGHGNGRDDDGDGTMDGSCDPDEDPAAPPETLMTPPSATSTFDGAVSYLQETTARAVALVTLGARTSGSLARSTPATLGDGEADVVGDAESAFIDLLSVHLSTNTPSDLATVTHRPVGFVPENSSTRFLAFVDLDANVGTGGEPADLGFDTDVTGIELITSVEVSDVGGAHTLVPTVWEFWGGAFAEISDPAIAAAIEREIEGHEGAPQRDAVTLSMPRALLGVAALPRLQALAQDLSGGTGESDRLPDGASATAELGLVSPELPACDVADSPVRPGTQGHVDAAGMVPEATAQVLLADRVVGAAPTDVAGATQVPFLLAASAPLGPQVLSVRSGDGALSASCTVDVSGLAPPLLLTPATSRNDPGLDHTVTVRLVEPGGAPSPGIAVTFSVDSGPNAGVGGRCSFNADCTTDTEGVASFTYTSDGRPGVDQMTASFVDASGATVRTNTALKFWDVDCNQNDVADLCDLDCAGFGGLCRAELSGACGGSEDANGDGHPDECNQPPDCTLAGAEPDELWPPLRQLEEVGIAGVTDEDGIAVALTIVSVFQDEPVMREDPGDAAPDAFGVGEATVSVRAERAGEGDGRLYHVAFEADDGEGGLCAGTVTVCVPHDQRGGRDCVDGGPLFDSTVGPPCGPGFELALLLPGLMWLRPRRRRIAPPGAS